MKNKLGKKENLKEYHKNGKLAYQFTVVSDVYSWEATYDNQGNETSYKNSDGFSTKATYDNQGNQTSYKNSDDDSWVATYDDQNRMTSYEDSDREHWKRVYNENGTYERINL